MKKTKEGIMFEFDNITTEEALAEEIGMLMTLHCRQLQQLGLDEDDAFRMTEYVIQCMKTYAATYERLVRTGVMKPYRSNKGVFKG